jgi:hypothetical protein
MMQMSGDSDYPLLSATPYLRMFGNVVVGWLLLEQAAIAHAALEKIYAERGASDAEKQKTLRADHTDARYYHNKIETARFFASNILAQNDGLAAAIQSNDRSPLDMDLEL